jgi:hypothetical protein
VSDVEAGAFFLLVVAIIALAVLGGGVYALAMALRRKKLHPEGDTVERESFDQPLQPDETARDRREGQRPEHVEVESEQRSRFVGTR